MDLDAGPVTVTLPKAGDRFRSMIVISEDHYVTATLYDAGTSTFTRESVGTRYALFGIRILVDPEDPADVGAVHALQDAMTSTNRAARAVSRFPPGTRKARTGSAAPSWFSPGRCPDTRGLFGAANEVERIRHLIGSASAWGSNPQKDAFYLTVTPERNDGKTVYRLAVPADVPVDGFWSISRYNAEVFKANLLGRSYRTAKLSRQPKSHLG